MGNERMPGKLGHLIKLHYSRIWLDIFITQNLKDASLQHTSYYCLCCFLPKLAFYMEVCFSALYLETAHILLPRYETVSMVVWILNTGAVHIDIFEVILIKHASVFPHIFWIIYVPVWLNLSLLLLLIVIITLYYYFVGC